MDELFLLLAVLAALVFWPPIASIPFTAALFGLWAWSTLS